MNVLTTFLNSLNEILAAAIVVVAVSMLLYNITRNSRDRVARTSGAVLACVTISYIVDVFLSLDPSSDVANTALRLQWIGIAYIPATLFHLSDALLATTGLPSRGRRRRAARLLYFVGTVFLLLATLTDALVYPVSAPDNSYATLRAAPLFWVYLAYFLIATVIAFINVNRARKRCQTRSTKRRMAYLQVAMLTPVLGIFPFSALLMPGEAFSLWVLVLVNAANIIVILMLMFLAYPLSFFGSRIPDRVVKADLLRFMLRGPATGLIILVVMISTQRATEILGLSGSAFMPFALVAAVLFWQWMVDLALPLLDKRLIYNKEDDDQVEKIQALSRSLLTRGDLIQLLEAIIQASCDYLNVNNGFIASINKNGELEIARKIGNGEVTNEVLRAETAALIQMFSDGTLAPLRWRSYWLFGLYSRRITDDDGNLTLIGWLGVEAQNERDPISADDDRLFGKLVRRAAQTLDDLLLQSDLYAALEGLLPQIAITRDNAAEIEYKPGHAPLPPVSPLPERDQMIEQVQAALRHYYGGPGMSQSRLLELHVVREALPENDHNPVKALRAVLDKAIDNQRPAGEQDFRSQEWLLYNILEMRFIKKRTVRDTAARLFMSDANLYRKQNLAIEAVADALMKLEREALSRTSPEKTRNVTTSITGV
jgi:hypothetical protein